MTFFASWSTEVLSAWKDGLQVALFGFALLIPVLGYLFYLVDKELDLRMAAREVTLAERVKSSAESAQSARAEAERLRKKLEPRSIPAEKRGEILAILRLQTGTVQVIHLDPEGQYFAQQLVRLIREAGWDVSETGATGFGAIVGLRLDVHSQKDAPPFTGVLKKALEILGNEVPIRPSQNVPPDTLILTVGSKNPA